MFENKNNLVDTILLVISILAGLIVGIVITALCIHYKLFIFGVNIDVFIAPLVAGFVETFVSNLTRKKSSGAISAIILFFITNGIGWLFPTTPLKLNIFTIGGFLIMLQAAFPLMMNYIIIAVLFLLTYVFGLVGSFISFKLNKNEVSPLTVSEIEDTEKLGIYIFNSKPNVPIKEYHGLIFAEDIVDFDEKTFKTYFYQNLYFFNSKLAHKS